MTLIAYLGTMNAGKSTMALQFHHSLAGSGLLFTALGRDGEGLISSRIGLQHEAIEVTDEVSIYAEYVKTDPCPDYIIVDEAQFLDPVRVDQLGVIADFGRDVYAFGLKTNFLGELFPGSKRLVEIADRVEELPIPVLCWCGAAGRFNAKVVDGQVAQYGETVDVGDIGKYQVLCRGHFFSGTLSLRIG